MRPPELVAQKTRWATDQMVSRVVFAPELVLRSHVELGRHRGGAEANVGALHALLKSFATSFAPRAAHTHTHVPATRPPPLEHRRVAHTALALSRHAEREMVGAGWVVCRGGRLREVWGRQREVQSFGFLVDGVQGWVLTNIGTPCSLAGRATLVVLIGLG